MEKIKIAIVGYGNIGSYAISAVLNEIDMELVGVVRRDATVALPEELANIVVVDDITKLGKVDVAILCSPSRNIKEVAIKCINLGINTIDSFDIHNDIIDLKRSLSIHSEKNNTVSIVSAGWDPGSDSIIRGLLLAMAPKGITYTNFGPGMSMGHSVAAKAIDGVKEALSMTIPVGSGTHKRMVYVETEKNYDISAIQKAIVNDSYFAKDDTSVINVTSVSDLMDKGHGVNLVRKGVSGKTDNQQFEFNMKINNPALTSQILVSSARAAMRQKPGVYTLIEIPVIDFLYGNRDDIIAKLV